MALGKKQISIPQLMIMALIMALSPCCTSSLHDHDHYLEGESGYDFDAYPSYFAPFDDEKVVNDSIIWGQDLSDFTKLKSRVLASVATVNVNSYGAKGDGKSDDTKAFQRAWKAACSSKSDVSFLVPSGKTYLLKQVRFKGPCKAGVTVQVIGTLLASGDRSVYSKDPRHWLIFDSVNNLVVQGGGTINGNGNIWWKNSCKIDKSKICKNAPTAITFYKCTNLVVKNVKSLNAQQIHMSFEKCSNVHASDLEVTAPEKSPNTDGIHITGTKKIYISNSKIGTGDDCISIVSGSQTVRATDIFCGPGHGISIGSLGSGKSEEYVSDVVVNRTNLSGTTNGVRIKTWQGGSGSASTIRFLHIQMQNVKNPIIIDQNYCDQKGPCKQQSAAVQVKDVVYQNIKGTSASNVAIDFDCSQNHPCQGIVLQDVNLVGAHGRKVKAVCNNVKLQTMGTVSPRCS